MDIQYQYTTRDKTIDLLAEFNFSSDTAYQAIAVDIHNLD